MYFIGELYFMLQLCELRKHQLSEGHVRLYCISNKKRHGAVNNWERELHISLMRTCHPDDVLGSPINLLLPGNVVHHIGMVV